MSETVPAVSVQHVSFRYGVTTILQDVCLDIVDGEFLGLVGPNGGGKTTLLRIILGLLKPQQGVVRIHGISPHAARGKVGYVPQYTEFARDFPICVEDIVLLGRLGRTSPFFGYRATDRAVAERAMTEAGVVHLRRNHVSELSGGQLQRVVVARALACDPDILLLDEPTANVDLRAEEDIFDLLRKLNERMTIIVVSHDVGFISGYVQRVACLNQTLVCHTTDEIKGEVIENLYGADVRMIHHHGHHH